MKRRGSGRGGGERERHGSDEREPIDELVEEARGDNPDETTRREAYELELMEEDRSQEGAEVEVDEPGDGAAR